MACSVASLGRMPWTPRYIRCKSRRLFSSRSTRRDFMDLHWDSLVHSYCTGLRNLDDGRQGLILWWEPWRSRLYVVAWDLCSGWTRGIGLRFAKDHSWTWAMSNSWNIGFDETVKSFRFSQLVDVPCVYSIRHKGIVVLLILWMDDILLIWNDVGILQSIKVWLAKQFDMKDLGEAWYVLGIRIYRDRKNKMLALSQATYIDKVMASINM